MYSRFPDTCRGFPRQRIAKPVASWSFALICALLISLGAGCGRKSHSEPVASATQQTLEPHHRAALRVCADPNNLPFSNDKGEGFENKLAELVGREMHLDVQYTWWAQRRGFFRNTLKAGECDLVVGVPSSFEMALTTTPYYRSTYVFVYPKSSGIKINSFDDEILKKLRIGVQMIGDDFANTPPAHALANRGIVGNVKGYTIYGDYHQPNPPATILDALAKREIDVAIVWGPLAGYFAPREKVDLDIVPVNPQIDQPFLPFVYDISMGVRRDDPGFKEELDRIIEQKRAEIDEILGQYGVPRIDNRG